MWRVTIVLNWESGGKEGEAPICPNLCVVIKESISVGYNWSAWYLHLSIPLLFIPCWHWQCWPSDIKRECLSWLRWVSQLFSYRQAEEARRLLPGLRKEFILGWTLCQVTEQQREILSLTQTTPVWRQQRYPGPLLKLLRDRLGKCLDTKNY